MHGIAAVGIVAFIAILAVVARIGVAGTGPFATQVASVTSAGDGLAVTLSVTNGGSNATATTCQVREADPRVGATVEVVQTPKIEPGTTIEVSTVTTRFGSEAIALVAQCGSQ
jgi:hypothetical protein